MKKFFSSEKGKRVLIGLGMIALAMIIGYFLQGVLLESGVRWKQAIFFLVVSGTGVGGLLYIFFGRKGLLIGYGILLYFSLIIILMIIKSGIAGVLVALPIIVGPALMNYLARRKKSTNASAATRSEKNYRLVQDQQDAWVQLHSQNAPLLVAKKSNGTIYQLFFQDGNILFYKVGSFFKNVNANSLKDEGNLPPLGKDDFKIILKDVTTLRFHDVYSDNNPFDMEISIYTWEKRYFLSAILAEGGTKLEQLVREKMPEHVQQERRTVPHFIPSLNRERRDIIRKIYFGVCVFATIVCLAWLFLDVPYHVFAWLALLPTPMLLLLHYLFPNEVTLAEEKKFAHGRIMIILPMLLTIFPLFLRVNVDFDVFQQGKLFLYAGILLVLLISQAYIISKECRIRKIELVVLAFILAGYCMCSVAITNLLLDQTPPIEKSAIVLDKDVVGGRSSSYYLDVKTEDMQDYSLIVDLWIYRETEVGDSVLILFYRGAFDIPYAVIEELP